MSVVRTWLLTLSVLLFLVGTGDCANEAPAVELLTDTPFLQPTSTIELRFAAPMVTREELGFETKESPLVIQPPIPGTFTWLSRSSGVYVPSAPPPLGTKFAATLRPGLKTADGKPLEAKPSWPLETPPFNITLTPAARSEDGVALSEPELKVAFNLGVDLTGAAKLIQFVNARGETLAANVRYATRRDFFQIAPEQDAWNKRWQDAQPGHAKTDSNDEENEDENGEETKLEDLPKQTNKLIINPTRPLSPGAAWRLEVKAGIKAEDGVHEIKKPLSIPLGEVKPFEITELRPSNFINSGRSAMVEFSREFAPDITPESAAKFFHVEPEVPNLKYEGEGTTITIRGDFARDREYRLVAEPTVVSAEGFPLQGEHTRTFRFEPIKPRLYLPEITGHQLSSGQRRFDVLSSNLQSLKVTAQLIPATGAAQAAAAFSKYDAEDSTKDEPHQKIPPGTIRGKVLYEKTIALPRQPIDSRQQTQLDWTEVLGKQKNGAVFLTVEGEPLPEVGGSRVGAQALLQLTDLGVLWKKLEDRLQVTVFSMASGKPLAGVHMQLLDGEFAVQGGGTTDAAGTALLPAGVAPEWLVASKGDDSHATRIETDLPTAAFNLPMEYRSWPSLPEEKPVRGLIFTDRPIYQPGETVHVKGILRRVDGTGLKPAANVPLELKLTDKRDTEKEAIQATTDARGSFDAEVKLSGISNGKCSLQLSKVEDHEVGWQRSFIASFEVADYQPNAFELSLALPPRLAPEAEVRADLSAKYYFGAPLTAANYRWNLTYTRDTFAPEGFAAWQFGSTRAARGRALTLHGEGTLDGPKVAVIAPKLPTPSDAPHRGVLTVEVTDINQQTVSETRAFTRDAGGFYLGLAVPNGIVFHSGDEITAQAVAVQPDGEPVAKPVDVTAELIYMREETVRVQGADKAVAFRTETVEEPAGKAAGQTLIPTRGLDQWEARQGVSLRMKAAKAGRYVLRATAHDEKGRAVTSDMEVYVSGPEELAWDFRNPAQIDLVADKQEYKPGETARILAKTPFGGEALVTIERGRQILRTMHVRLEGNSPTIELPMLPGDAPNVFISVMLIRGQEQSTRKFKTPEYRYGMANLRVSDASAALQVTLKPARQELQPGDEQQTEVAVLDGKGAPVKDAEVTLFAIDDGVLALTGYERPMPGTVFSAPFLLGVRTGLTLFQLFPEDPADLEFSNKGYLIGGGGLDGPGTKLRRDFAGTACWFPSLRTDASGNAMARFRVPDSLTRYRIVAVANAGANQFGSAESSFNTRKSLLVLPALGQFANMGDELIARAVIRNDTGKDAETEISLALDSTAESKSGGAEGLTKRITIRNGEAQTVDFPVHIRAMGHAEWKWAARIASGGQSIEDHVISSLTVGSPAPVLRETYLTDAGAPSNNLLAGVNPQLLEGTGTVDVAVANTRLVTLREGANQLLEYPYGCAEQTVSSLIPWALSTELRNVMPVLAKPEAEVSAAIQKGVDRLFSMQTQSGGIAMWPGSQTPSLFISAYAALGCTLLQHAELADPAGLPDLLKFLSEELKGAGTLQDERSLGDRAMALYALAAAGQPEAGYHEEMFRRRGKLSYESRAILALAIREAKGPASMIEELLNPRAAAPEGFSYFGGAARERAVQLLAWSSFKPRSPEVGKLVKELLGLRTSAHWGTTQQNAWALLALARYYATAEAGPKDVSGTLVMADQKVPFRLSAKKPLLTKDFSFDPASTLPSLTALNSSKGLLFSEARFVVRPPVAEQPRQDRGYSVSRSYQKLGREGALEEAKDLKVGDRVLVTLRVETRRPGHFVAIDDPIPAILEVVNPAFKSQEVGGADALTTDGASDYREIRSDRVLYFVDHLAPGTYGYKYLARVRAAGSTRAGATKVEEMYRPERFGIGEVAKLSARGADEK